MAKTLVILNPISGRGAGARLWPSIEAALRDGHCGFDSVWTTAPREAIGIAERAKRNGYETLIAIGGDGTVNEVANGIMRASGTSPSGVLGVIPVGSGNDFVKMLDLRPDWRAAVERILAGRLRWVDVGRVVGDLPAPGYETGAHYFVNGLDTGFGALVAMYAHQVPLVHGVPMYLAAVFRTLMNYYVPRVHVDLDEDPVEQSSTMIAVSNGRCYGGGFWLTPTASVDDGLFDVMIADGLGRRGILSLLPRVMRGTHVGDPRVRFSQASRVMIQSPDPLAVEADGEIPFTRAHRLEIEILPKRLQVLA